VVTWYEFALWVHVFATVVWVGGDVMLQLLAHRIMRSNDGPRLAGFAKDAERIGMFVLTPASILVLAFGFVLVEEGNWSYDFWIIFGLVVLGLAAVLGMAVFGPQAGRASKLIEQHGPDHPEAQRLLKRVIVTSRITTVLLLLVVFDMVVKPFL
jgi:uncharacterized membrane protein